MKPGAFTADVCCYEVDTRSGLLFLRVGCAISKMHRIQHSIYGHKLNNYIVIKVSRVSSVGIVTGYRMDGRGVGVHVPVSSAFHSVQTGSGAQPEPLSLGGKVAGASGRIFTSN
jgi:hypothetical protein